MSTEVEQRIVEMRFDNKEFERNVSTTMSTLEKFKQNLKLKGATAGLEQIDAAAKKVDFSQIENAAYTSGFSIKDVWLKVASVFEYQVARRIINAAGNIAKALTITPITTGFQEYETQMNAVQTILANTESKGKTLDDVNAALDELNTYADKTIYNFTEMTRNIGTFTAAGVDLDTSVSAIKGIANLAAVSGSNSQQASTAMYQLSQAMASGTVKLMDWNSVVNAGMGGQVFQDALKETAKVHGVAIDDIIKKQGSFRESLSEGWLTTEILTDTLAKFTGDLSKEQLKSQGYTDEQIESIMKLGQTANDAATKVKTFTQLFDTLKEAAQSGWTQTWEILVGDFEEAKELLTNISDVVGEWIGKSAEARNSLLEDWKTMGGRDDLIQSIKNIVDALGRIITPIKEAFTEIFPPVTAKQLVNITEAIKNFTENLKISDSTADNLKRTFKGIFSVFSIVGQVISAVVKTTVKLIKGIFSLFGGAENLANGIFNLTGNIGDAITTFKDFLKETGALDTVFNSIATVVLAVFGVVKKLVTFLTDNFVFPGIEAFSEVLSAIRDKFISIKESASNMGKSIGDAFKSMGDKVSNNPLIKAFKFIWDGIVKICEPIISYIKAFGSNLANILLTLDLQGILDIVKTIFTGGLLIGLTKLAKTLSEVFSNKGPFGSVKGAIDGFSEAFEAFTGQLKAMQNQIKVNTVKQFAIAIAILTASMIALTFVDKEKMVDAAAGITVLVLELAAAMSLMEGMSLAKGLGGKLVGMSIAILILVSAVKKLAAIDSDELTKGVTGLVGVVLAVALLGKVAGTVDPKSIKSLAKTILPLSIAMLILMPVLEKLAGMDWGELGKAGAGLAGFTVFLMAVSAMSNVVKPAKMYALGFSLMPLSAALLMLIPTIKILAGMEWSALGKAGVALTGLTVFILGLSAVSRVVNAGGMITMAVCLQTLGVSLLMLIPAIKLFANMEWTELSKAGAALGGLTVFIVGLSAASQLVNVGGMLTMALCLRTFGLSLLAMMPAVKLLAGLEWQQLGKVGAALGGLVAAIAVLGAVATLAGPAGMLSLALGLTATAIALNLMIPPLTALTAIGFVGLIAGLAPLAIGLAAVGLAGTLLAPAVPAVLALAVALGIMSLSTLAVGAGLTLIAAAIASLAATLAVGTDVIINGFIKLLKGLVGLIPEIFKMVVDCVISIAEAIAVGGVSLVKAVGVLLVGLCEVIIDCIPSIMAVAVELISALCEALSETAPKIIDTLMEILVALMGSLSEYAPVFVEFLFDLIISVLEGISKKIPELIKAVSDVFMALFQGVIDALKNIDPETILKGLVSVGILAALMGALSAISTLIPGAMLGVLGITAVVAELALAVAAFGALAQIPGLQWLISEGGNFLQAVGTAIGQFIGGIVGGVAEGVTSTLPQIGTNLSNFMTNLQPFLDGAKSIDDSLLESVKTLVGVILSLTGANLLDQITSWITGGSSMASFAEELIPFGTAIAEFSRIVSGVDEGAVLAAANAGKMLAEMAKTIPGSGPSVVSFFAGQKDLGVFGTQVSAFGRAIAGFSKTVSGNINEEAVLAAANSGKVLAEMASTIPSSGPSVVSFFVGQKDLGVFGTQVTAFGRAMANFSKTVAGKIDETAVTAAANAGKTLVELNNALPNSGGLKSWFSGEKDMSKFGSQIVSFGDAMVKFSKAVAGKINETAVTAATNAGKALQKISSMDVSGVNNAISAMLNVARAADGMKTIDFGPLNKLGKALGEVGKTGVDKFVKAFTGATEKVTKAVKTLVSGAVDALDDYYDDFYSAGESAAKGFAAGISENSFRASAKAAAMASAALEAAKEALKINSPSKAFISLGKSTGEGYIIGVNRFMEASYAAGSQMGTESRNGMMDAIRRIGEAIDCDIDTEPTIRPVVDLSSVYSSAGTLNRLFDTNSSIGILSEVGYISSSMNRRSQNGSNDDVVSAIDKLNDNLQNAKGDTYNINGVEYDENSDVAEAIKIITRALKVERRR